MAADDVYRMATVPPQTIFQTINPTIIIVSSRAHAFHRVPLGTPVVGVLVDSSIGSECLRKHTGFSSDARSRVGWAISLSAVPGIDNNAWWVLAMPRQSGVPGVKLLTGLEIVMPSGNNLENAGGMGGTRSL